MISESTSTPFGSEDYSSAVENSPTHETESILHQIVEVRDHDRQLSDFLIDSLLTERRGLVVMGEPGNGKTTITTQLRDALEKEALERGMKVEVVLKRYDEYLAQKEEEYGKRELWTPEEWKGLNDFMYEDYALALDAGDTTDGVRRIHLLELPAVGSDEERDRGVGASRKLFERARNQETPDTQFIFVTINTLLQQKSSFLRRVVVDPSLPDREVVPLLARHNQIVVGNMSNEEKGRRVKEIFRKSAQPEHIAKIRKEAAEEIAEWEDRYNRNTFATAVKNDPNASRDAREYDILGQRIRGMRHPVGVTDEKVREVYSKYNADVDNAFFQVKAATVLDAAMRQAVYAEHLLHNTYGLDDDTAFVVHNPYDPASVITIDVGEEHQAAA